MTPATRRSFAVTWDYRCPFARIAHLHVIEGLRAGADWDVAFVPFSLGQVHRDDGQPDVWDDPSAEPGRLSLQVGLVVRDEHPEAFLDVHEALFDARHVHGLDLRDDRVLRDVLVDHGLDADADAVLDAARTKGLETLREEHRRAAATHEVWGVPTFVAGDQAGFVRLMDPPGGDGEEAVRTVERVLDLLTGWPALNELKHTSIPR
ncbi:MAG: DsbA family protein [Acidimicrobiales bacterium]|nr:DsbA family protein [Acidimicrobiales bacterium]MCB9371945.1 DsbA family protein [Microthrixaceae bacterium]